MHWIVQENIRREAGYDKFTAGLRELNVPHTAVKVVPFSWETVPEVRLSGPVTAWGSLSMTDVAAKNYWKPGVWLNENFDQRVWTAAYGRHCLNREMEIHEFCKVPEFDGQRFIRPVHDRKVFAGAVFDWPDFLEQQERVEGLAVHFKPERRTVCHDTPVAVSMVQEISSEHRFFVVDGVVCAGSMYKLHGGRIVEEVGPLHNAWKFAQDMAGLWCPDLVWVVDVALVWDTEAGSDSQRRDDRSRGLHCLPGDWAYKVIEINCANSCGFYAADMRPVIRAVEWAYR